MNATRSLSSLAIVAAMLLAACTSSSVVSPAETGRIPVIIDTDMGSNGIMAILYALNRPDFDIEAITIAGTGETHCDPGIAHALGMVALVDGGNIPVACGRDTPLAGDHKFPSDWRAAADSAMGITWPKGGAKSNLAAPRLIAKVLKDADRPVTIIADGPLTNLAEVFQKDERLASKVHMIYLMGGAVDVPGNIMMVPLTSPNYSAEFNIFIDPRAASIVLGAGAPVTIVPLDATNQAPLDGLFYDLLAEHQASPSAKTVYDMLTETKEYERGSSLWDPLTYAIAGDERLAGFVTKKITVVEEEGPDIGRTMVRETGSEVRVAMTIDYQRFVEEYFRVLNGGRAVTIDWAALKQEAHMQVTFSEGKCEFAGAQQVPSGKVGIHLSNKIREKNALLAVVTLDEGKTIADLNSYPSAVQPDWAQLLSLEMVSRGMERVISAEVTSGPVYLVCITMPPTTKVGAFGPVEVIPGQ